MRLLPLPKLKPKGDVINWLEAGGTKEELLRLADAAPEWAAPASDASTLIITSAAFTAGFVPPDYLIDGLLQTRFIYSMTGPTGAGKTCVAMRIGAHVAFGLTLAGREVTQGKEQLPHCRMWVHPENCQTTSPEIPAPQVRQHV